MMDFADLGAIVCWAAASVASRRNVPSRVAIMRKEYCSPPDNEHYPSYPIQEPRCASGLWGSSEKRVVEKHSEKSKSPAVPGRARLWGSPTLGGHGSLG